MQRGRHPNQVDPVRWWWRVKGTYRSRAGVSSGEWSQVVEATAADIAADIAQRDVARTMVGGRRTAVVLSVDMIKPPNGERPVKW